MIILNFIYIALNKWLLTNFFIDLMDYIDTGKKNVTGKIQVKKIIPGKNLVKQNYSCYNSGKKIFRKNYIDKSFSVE